MIINYGVMRDAAINIFPYITVSLELLILSLLLSIVLGGLTLLIRIKNIPLLKQLVELYILLGRATPTLVILYIVFYAIPIIFMPSDGLIDVQSSIWTRIPPFVYAVIGLALHSGAYTAEIFYAAYKSIPKGQTEAGLAIGMSEWTIYRRFIIPQAIVFAIPSMANETINLLKGTSIASIITVTELFGAANVEATNHNLYLEIFIVLTIIYWSLSIILEEVFNILEDKSSFYKKATV